LQEVSSDSERRERKPSGPTQSPKVRSCRVLLIVATAAILIIAAYLVPQRMETLPTKTLQTYETQYTGTTLGNQTLPLVRSLIVQPNDSRSAILDAIQKAKQSIRVTIYALNDPDITASLIAAHKRGVEVRVLYNFHSFAREGVGDPNKPTVDMLASAGVQTKRASESFAVTHQKTICVDDSMAIVMTFNLQANYFGHTRDFGVVTIDPAEVEEIARVFEADWSYQSITPSLPQLVWSPVNSREKILRVINGATKTLEVYNEELQDRECIQALISAAKRGVTVRLISAELMRRGQDENAAGRQLLNNGGVQAKAGKFLYIHAKMILADYGTDRQVAFIGSENFSTTSLDKNRELGILANEQAILDRLHSTFELDWSRRPSASHEVIQHTANDFRPRNFLSDISPMREAERGRTSAEDIRSV